LRKLRQFDAAWTLDGLRNPPGNRLEALEGDRKGRVSLRINDRSRSRFVRNDGEAVGVEIFDHHRRR
jgi:proteic killer suppression protein